jgi:hypothetical protein
MITRSSVTATEPPPADHNRPQDSRTVVPTAHDISEPHSILDSLKQAGLEVEPWFYVVSRDRLAWVTLNGPTPLMSWVPKSNERSERRMENGQYEWDWSILPDFDYTSHPWRAYIPLGDDCVRHGAQGWVFSTLSPENQSEASDGSPSFCLHRQLKTNIQLTFQAIHLVGRAVENMYGMSIPTSLHLGSMEWINGEYEMASLNAIVWDARRKVLELYGWLSYVLKCDSQGWSERNWDDTFFKLINILCFLQAPRRGCIIEPALSTVDDIITLVRHDVPIHYQWRAQNGVPVLGGWIEPIGHAALFNPYAFRTYDYAAYLEAGGKYNDSALERSALGRDGAAGLASSFYSSKKYLRLYELPKPPASKVGKKKGPLRCFVRDHVGGVLTEIDNKLLSRLQGDNGGDVLEKKHRSGDMKLLTLYPFSPPLLDTGDLSTFFDALGSYKHANLLTTSDAIGSAIIRDTSESIQQNNHDNMDLVAPNCAPALISSLAPDVEADLHVHLKLSAAQTPHIECDLLPQNGQSQEVSTEDLMDAISMGDEDEVMSSENILGEVNYPTQLSSSVDSVGATSSVRACTLLSKIFTFQSAATISNSHNYSTFSTLTVPSSTILTIFSSSTATPLLPSSEDRLP